MSGSLFKHLVDVNRTVEGRRLGKVFTPRTGQRFVAVPPAPVRSQAEHGYTTGRAMQEFEPMPAPLQFRGEPVNFSTYSANNDIFEPLSNQGARPRGTLLNRVMEMGQGAGDMGRRAIQAPGNLMNIGLDNLQASTYRHLMSNAGDRAEQIAQEIYSQPYYPKLKVQGGGQLEADQVMQTNRRAFNQLRDTAYQNLDDRARDQAALIPGGMRAAGRAAKSPLAMTAYGVGGTLAVGNMLEDQGQQAQLIAMGLTPEEAEILANEMAMAAQNMEPLPVF